MPIGLDEDHLALQEAARRFLSARCPPSLPRALVDATLPGEEAGAWSAGTPAEASRSHGGARGATAGDDLPVFWEELVALGWLGLHLPEEAGGSGYGLVELAVVLEELGRAMAPGPFLPTVLASAVIAAGASERQRAALLPGLADGSRTAAVHWAGAPVRGADSRGSLRLEGHARPVLGGAGAAIVVLPVSVGNGERWVVVEDAGASAVTLGSIDATRPVAEIDLSGVEISPDAVLGGVNRTLVGELVAVLAGAEACGIADWCLSTASEYAKVREQFGRPIGQFQAVKHKCADMLVATEAARSAVWDAAVALGAALGLHGAAEVDPPSASLAAAAAGSTACEVAARCAKDCVQILGGIGFTWEHDAHLYLKRALALRQLVPSEGWRRRTAALAASGARRHLQLELPDAAEAVRAEVHTFAASVKHLDRAEQRRRVVDAGYFVPHWPPPWGRGAGAVEQLVIDQEFRAARIRRPNLSVGAWAAPTIVAHGSPEQQERWVRPTLLGEISWCQMFSEPGAGSDLASLSTKATRADGGWLLSGQKVWTSMAREADWAICLARTNPTAPKHLGITYFIVDMRSAGLDVRPLRELTGFAMFNEIFLSDVFVPDDCVIGEVDGGWPLARTTLANERVAMSSGSSFGGGVESLLELVASRGGPDALDPADVDTLGALLAEAQAVAVLGLRTTLRAVTGAKPGPESSVRKLLGVEHDQRVQEFGLHLLGAEGATTEGPAGQWSFGFLANRCLTIAGGTSEVQRNVIAERLLGLPRDP